MIFLSLELSLPGSAFAMGITLEEIKVFKTNSSFEPKHIEASDKSATGFKVRS